MERPFTRIKSKDELWQEKILEDAELRRRHQRLVKRIANVITLVTFSVVALGLAWLASFIAVGLLHLWGVR